MRRGSGVSGRGGGSRGEEPCWAVGESSAQREAAESSSSLKDNASVAGRWSERVACWRGGRGQTPKQGDSTGLLVSYSLWRPRGESNPKFKESSRIRGTGSPGSL